MAFISIITSFFTKFKFPIYVAVFGVAMLSSAWVGYKLAEGAYTEVINGTLENVIAQYQADLTEAQKESQKVVEVVTKIEYRDRIIRDEIIEYVETNPQLADSCVLDDEGLRIWNGEE